MSRRLSPVLILAVLALVAAGCGGGEGVRTTAETEGLYLDIGGLKYQIQGSRYMNADDVEDSQILAGLPDGVAEPGDDESWFGVWVRIQNETDEPLPAASVWEIHDTQENIYRPVPIDSPFAFEPGEVPPGTVIPKPDSAAGQGPNQGALLLFKLKYESFHNRPLELVFGPEQGDERGTYALDV
jgi:hypothetical protein